MKYINFKHNKNKDLEWIKILEDELELFFLGIFEEEKEGNDNKDNEVILINIIIKLRKFKNWVK